MLYQQLMVFGLGFACAAPTDAAEFLVRLERTQATETSDALSEDAAPKAADSTEARDLKTSTTAIEVSAPLGQPFRVRIVDGPFTWLFRGTITEVKEGQAVVSLDSWARIDSGQRVKVDDAGTLTSIFHETRTATRIQVELGRQHDLGGCVTSTTERAPNPEGTKGPTSTRKSDRLRLTVSAGESAADSP